jgi:hypothetical protein
MPVRPTRTAPGRRTVAAAPAARTTRAKRNPLAEYVTREATAYQKAFARWLVEEVGYEPTNKKDFLAAIRLAITTRNLFNSSDWIEQWRERTGETKRGPKPKTAAPAPTARGKRKPEPEPEEEEFDDEEETEEELASEDSDDFEDDTEEPDADDDDWEDEEDAEEEEEPTPAPKQRARSTRTAGGKPAPARKAAPAKKAAPAGRKSKPPADDDDFVF